METRQSGPRVWQSLREERIRDENSRPHTSTRESIRRSYPTPSDGETEPSIPSGEDEPAATGESLAFPNVCFPQRFEDSREPKPIKLARKSKRIDKFESFDKSQHYVRPTL